MSEENKFFRAENKSGELFFTKRRTQVENALSEFYPDVMALFSELIQNSDDAQSTEMVIGFTDEGLYISNNGTSFNMGAVWNNHNESVEGDLESITLSVTFSNSIVTVFCTGNSPSQGQQVLAVRKHWLVS